MANEAQVRTSLIINVGNLSYSSQPTAFTATVTGVKGPVPGAFSVPTTGKNVSFGELTIPSLCRLMNLDTTNYVEYGIYDGASFFPLGELMPGESYIIRLTRNLLEEYVGTGTGTTGPVNFFHMKAHGAACNVVVEAFEK